MVDDYFSAGRAIAVNNARNEAAGEAQAKRRAQAQRDKAADNANGWYEYAMELEEFVIELGSRLDATTTLIEQILRAANGEPVEHADQLLAADEAGEAVRRDILKRAQETSMAGMAEAHQERLKVIPDATRKFYAINQIYAPKSERATKKWADFIKIKAARGDKLPTQNDMAAMRELLLELGPELLAANNLVLRLLAEGNGSKVEQELMPAVNHEQRRAFLESRTKTSRAGMIEHETVDISKAIKASLGEQQMKIAKRVVAPIPPPTRTMRV